MGGGCEGAESVRGGWLGSPREGTLGTAGRRGPWERGRRGHELVCGGERLKGGTWG